jgi:hypothetical protein
VSTTFKDPLSVSTQANAIMGTLGTKLEVGFFSLNASYTLGEFSTASTAVSFKF